MGSFPSSFPMLLHMLFFDKLWPDQEVRPHRPSIGYREISLWGPVLLKQSFKQTAPRHTAGGNQKEGVRGILPPAVQRTCFLAEFMLQ